jgi:hypothetical protein
MRRSALIIIFLLCQMAASACEVCKKQQPKVLAGVTHGAGPQSNWDYVIVIAMVIIVIVTSWFSIRWLLRPGETSADHIKRSILNS